MLGLVALMLVGCGESGSASTSPTAPGAPGATPAPPPQTPDGAVVATVGPGFVTDAEFAAAAARSATPGQDLPLEKRKEILEKLVTEEVLFQEAAAKGLYRDPKVRKIMVNLLLREEIYADVRGTDITPEELEAYYSEHRDEFVVPEKVQVKRIFIRYGEGARTKDDAKALATDIQKQLRADSSKFKELAEQYSDDPYKRRGGDLGYLSREGKPGIPPEVVEKAFSLNVGQVSPPFEAGDGFNVVQVAAKREAVERTFDQMKGSVLRRLKNDRFQQLTDEYIAQARGRYDVKIDEAALAATKIEARPMPGGDPGALEDEHDHEEEGLDEPSAEGDGEMIPWLVALAQAGVVDRVVAIVNDEVVTLSNVYDIGADYVAKKCPAAEGAGVDERCATEAELEVLDSLLRRVLIRQELNRLDLDVTAANVDQAIDATVRQYQLADRQALRAEVEAAGKRWDKYREELEEVMRQQTFQGRVLAPRVTIRDDEVKDFYQRTARNVRTPTAKVSGLGVAIPPGTTPEQEAEMVAQTDALAEALNKGEVAWDEAVKLYDAGFARVFAGIEWTPTSIIEPLSEVVFAAEPGVAQKPVRMQAGNGMDVLMIVRVDEKGEKSEVAPFEEIEEQLKDQLFREKLEEAEEEWYQRARREAAIDIKLKVAEG